jgi:hypothetical protein
MAVGIAFRAALASLVVLAVACGDDVDTLNCSSSS